MEGLGPRKLMLDGVEASQQHKLASTSDSVVHAALLTAQHTGFLGLLTNSCFVSAFASFALAQLAKVFTHYASERTWDWNRLVGSGGMPSSHTAFVVGLTTAVGVKEGTGSSVFALCLVVALIVMYDATGVRLHAGKQATVLNLIIAELPSNHPVQDSGRLRDTLGHTPVQVLVGAILGVVVGYVVALQFVTGGSSGGDALAPGAP